MNSSISPRESLDIHELIMFKVLCGTKAATMDALIQDEELKNMLQMDVTNTKDQLKELHNLISNDQIASNNNQ